jgi:hypothetical protein
MLGPGVSCRQLEPPALDNMPYARQPAVCWRHGRARAPTRKGKALGARATHPALFEGGVFSCPGALSWLSRNERMTDSRQATAFPHDRFDGNPCP